MADVRILGCPFLLVISTFTNIKITIVLNCHMALACGNKLHQLIGFSQIMVAFWLKSKILKIIKEAV
ncbi:MAG: hypothetical protein IPM42_17525 [Saprospiraceae bacterium]|nr:hypothetical protein [Saprospiraceae bacterium]